MAFFEELGYLESLQYILKNGHTIKTERTNVGTIMAHALQLRFNLKTFPLLTSKRVPFKTVAKELLWFLSGSTDVGILQKQGVRIWDANSDRAFLDKHKFFEREVNDIGPGYGFQWRHFGAEYKDHKTDYSGKGKDQLTSIIDDLKNNRSSRRIVLNSWNPEAVDDCNLPPCHCFTQFNVVGNKLFCSMTQRSGDMALGIPFNIASYSLLTYILAKMTDLEPCELVLTINNAHVYLNHVENVKTQLKRIPFPPPSLVVKEKREKIEDYVLDDFELEGYKHHSVLNYDMAV